jgi:hypothetical protein
MRVMSMMAAQAIATVAAMGALAEAMPAPRKGSSRDYTDADIERAFARNVRPDPGPEELRRQALAREIRDHNAEVDRRKAEKQAAKRARRAAT